jgi:cystathionine gamma-synthase
MASVPLISTVSSVARKARLARGWWLKMTHSFSSPLSPAEAGERAEQLVLERKCSETDSAAKSMSTILAHCGIERPTHISNTAQSPPIHFSTTYSRPSDGTYLPTDVIYTREDNPTRRLLESSIAHLECHPHATDGLPKRYDSSPSKTEPGGSTAPNTLDSITCAFASGMMAISSVLLAHRTPLHVILPHDCYHGVPTVLHDVFKRFGQVTIETVDLTAPSLDATLGEALGQRANHYAETGVEGDTIVWIETPSNPKCHIIDITEVCQVVATHRNNESNQCITTVVDSTLAPPPIAQPLLHGADVVVHSATKYLSGHSDVLLGVATCSPWTPRGRMLAPELRKVQSSVGGVASPFDAWLTLRGLRTLETRISRQSSTALHIARFLEEEMARPSPIVACVHYPGLRECPAKARQMKKEHFGGVLSVEMISESHAMALAGALSTIQRATSLGGTETLIEHRSSIEPVHRRTSPPGLLRMSVGLEDPDDLVRDLRQALHVTCEVCGSFSQLPE